MKINSILKRGAFAGLILTTYTAFSASDQPQAEILHWWSSPGEHAALNVFIDEFQSRGGYYYDSTANDQLASREEAIERMGKGYPPTLTQWNAGWDVREFFEYGLIDSITDPVISRKLKDSLPPAVLDAVTYNDEIIAMPVNIHSENWMWYSNEVIEYRQSLISGDWQEFLIEGEKLGKKNIPLLAVGNQAWQVRILFTSLFLGISRDAYKKFYMTTDPSIVDSEEFKHTLTVFSKMAKFSQSFGDGNWNTQIKAVADNQAAATFMGDWAKGEFQTLKKTPGKEYGCALTSADDPSLLLVIDTFILGKVTDAAEKKGQAMMLDVVSDPEVNLAFNALKGSVSPFLKPSEENLDVCSAQVYKALAREESVIPPYAAYPHGAYMHKLDNEVFRLWQASKPGGIDAAAISSSIENFREILTDRKLSAEPPVAATEE